MNRMNEAFLWQAAGAEPDLRQFEPQEWVFPSEETRVEYTAAVDELREVMRDQKITRITARFLRRPTVDTVRAIIRSAKRMPRLDENSSVWPYSPTPAQRPRTRRTRTRTPS